MKAATWGGTLTTPAELWPLTLRLCRDCQACRLKLKMTLDGSISGALYYCGVTMHETDGRDRCADYRPRDTENRFRAGGEVDKDPPTQPPNHNDTARKETD